MLCVSIWPEHSRCFGELEVCFVVGGTLAMRLQREREEGCFLGGGRHFSSQSPTTDCIRGANFSQQLQSAEMKTPASRGVRAGRRKTFLTEQIDPNEHSATFSSRQNAAPSLSAAAGGQPEKKTDWRVNTCRYLRFPLGLRLDVLRDFHFVMASAYSLTRFPVCSSQHELITI